MTEGALRLLLIEDNPGDARLIREMLADARLDFELDVAGDLATGLDRLAEAPPDLVLLDLTLPDSRGLDTFHRVAERTTRTPVVVLSGLDDERLAMSAVHAGAQDYLVKGAVDGNLLARSIRYAIERKQTEARLHETNERLREAQRIAHLGSWEWDLATGVVAWSDELYRIYGLDPETVVTRETYLARVHPEDRPRVEQAIETALAERVGFAFEERVVPSDGKVRTLHSQGQIVLDDAGRAVRMIGVCQDITERKQAEIELARARDAALQSARLKSAFIANMSHEIRTPLNIILGYNEAISEDFGKLDEAKRQILIAGVRRAGDRLVATIDGILDLSKIETGNFEIRPVPIVLAPLLRRITEEFEILASENRLTLSLVIDEPRATVRFDEYCLTHAFMNLLQNALKFTREGGVTVRLGRDADGCLCIETRDTGVGIDPAYLPFLFQPFSQEEIGYTRRFEGAGLGLTLTKEYLELNEARISVDSEKGGGSVFRIHFSRDAETTAPSPPTDPGASSEERRALPEPAARRPKPKVLVVEDDPDTQAYMKVVLGKRYEVLLAATGAEVRQQLRDPGGRPFLVLMDLSLKGEEDGIALTRFLRKQDEWRDLPIIVTTAHAFPEDRLKALAAGCDAYLPKPIRRVELLSVMDELSRRSRSAAALN